MTRAEIETRVTEGSQPRGVEIRSSQPQVSRICLDVCSWSGLAPGNNESAGKKKRAPAMKGNPHIKTALVEAAWSATRTKQSEFQDRYQRLRPKIGHKRAIVASAHTLALRIYQAGSHSEAGR